MLGKKIEETYGRTARDRRAFTTDKSVLGARAALETFYFAFNARSLEVFQSVWAPDPSVTLANPLGGILAGAEPIGELYRHVFEGRSRVWVEYYDIMEYPGEATTLFVGRERGEFTVDHEAIPLAIRTTRCFHYLASSGWRQVHHHGSIDEPDRLNRYQAAVRGTRAAQSNG